MSNKTAELRATSNMRRLRKGDRFVDVVSGELVTFTVNGYPEIVDAQRVRIPVVRDGARPSRRTYRALDRVTLV